MGVERNLLTNSEAADLLRLKPRSLTVMRSRGDIPIPFIRVGRRRIMYRRSDIEAYLKAHTTEPVGAEG